MNFETFTLKEKKELLKEIVGVHVRKADFVDEFLQCKVLRIPLMIGNSYAGRDVIAVFDATKQIENLGFNDLKISYSSYAYRLIRNKDLKDLINGELEELVEDFNLSEKKESIADYSGLYRFEDKALIVRNSYVPSRSLTLALGFVHRIFIPVIRISRWHTDQTMKKIGIGPFLVKLNEAAVLMEEFQSSYWRDVVPEEFQLEIEVFTKKTILYRKGVRVDKIEEIGKEIVEEADKDMWTGLKLTEVFLERVYKKGTYTLKRKAENIILDMFDKKLKEIEPTTV